MQSCNYISNLLEIHSRFLILNYFSNHWCTMFRPIWLTSSGSSKIAAALSLMNKIPKYTLIYAPMHSLLYAGW
jgi:hypothetical protein